jgi:hypothetical protein
MTKKIVFNFQEEQSNLLVHKKKKKGNYHPSLMQ